MSDSNTNQVLELWSEIKQLLDDLDLDAAKNARGVNAAGVRLRKGLRGVKSKITELVRLTTALDKGRKTEKAE